MMWKRMGSLLAVLLLAGCATTSTPDRAIKPVLGSRGITPRITLADEADRVILQRLIDDMVVIPAGSFSMGDALDIGEDDELPVHVVNIARFAMGRFEVTFEQYDLYARMTGAMAPDDRWGRGRRPVIDVTWHDAMDFIEWLRVVTGIPFRLPTEAEWEYAARAGSTTKYSYGDDAAMFCHYGNLADSSSTIGWRNRKCSDGFSTTAPVGSFKANAFGLYDMYGNVWEWLSDCWFDSYNKAPADNSVWLDTSGCDVRAQRGGSWFSGPDEVRASYRGQGKELEKSVTLGFRLAHDLR